VLEANSLKLKRKKVFPIPPVAAIAIFIAEVFKVAELMLTVSAALQEYDRKGKSSTPIIWGGTHIRP